MFIQQIYLNFSQTKVLLPRNKRLSKLLVLWLTCGERMIRLRVKEVAEEKGLSMTRLSQRSEVSYNVVRRIFRYPFKPVSTEILQRLADTLEVPATKLIEDVPNDTMH
jgi:DNA-binding Xre family transcriptional regulator